MRLEPNLLYIMELLTQIAGPHGRWYTKIPKGENVLRARAWRFKFDSCLLCKAKEGGFTKYSLTKTIKELKGMGLVTEERFTEDHLIIFKVWYQL